MFIRCEMSALLEVKDSGDDFCECEVAVEMVEIAESIDDVRGIGRCSGRVFEGSNGGEAINGGDCGGEVVVGFDCGKGDEIFRSWL